MMTENIYTALHKVYQQVGYVQKKGRNDAQKYRYAGEADLIEALRPAMVEAGVLVFCSGVRDIETREHHTKNEYGKEKTTIHSVGTYEFTFAHAASGSSIAVMARGEGTDSLDKASYKAMTGALKYALRQTFVIETGDDPDHEPAPPKAQPRQAPPPPRGTEYSVVDRNNAVIAKSERVSTLLPALAGMRWTPDLADLNYDVAAAALKAAIDADKPGAHVKIKALRTQAEEVMAAIRRAMQDRKPDDDMANGMIDQPEMADA